MSRVATQQERSRAARRTIVDAALAIISDEGYGAMTMARIEAAAGSSRGLVNYHFGSKQGLTEAVIDQVKAGYVTNVVHAAGPIGETGLGGTQRVMRDYLAHLGVDARPNRVMLILIVESLAAQPVLQAPVRDLNALLRDSLAEQLRRGEHDGSVPAELATAHQAATLAGTLRGIALQWLADPAGVDLPAVSAAAVTALARACSPTPDRITTRPSTPSPQPAPLQSPAFEPLP